MRPIQHHPTLIIERLAGPPLLLRVQPPTKTEIRWKRRCSWAVRARSSRQACCARSAAAQADRVPLRSRLCKRCSSRGEQSLWRKHLDTRGCQFDGQRQPIESQTDLGDGRSIVRRQLKIGSDGLCPLEEQVHRWNVCERSVIWKMLGVWEREGWDGELVFGTQAQHLSARDKKLDTGQASNSSTSGVAAAMTCSKLSRSRSRCLSR